MSGDMPPVSTDTTSGSGGVADPGDWASGAAVHPMSVSMGSVRSAIGELVGFEPLYVPTAQKRELLRELMCAEAQLAAVRFKVLAVAGDVAQESGAKDVASWVLGDQPADARTVSSMRRGWPRPNR